MPAYAIVRTDVINAERFQDYAAKTPELLARYGAKFLVRGGDVTTLEGAEENRRMVLIEFESREKALELYQSDEYQELLKIIKESTKREFIIVDGL